MPEGEKVGEGYVEVTVDIDDNGLDTATEKATRKIDDGLKREAPGIGKHIGDGIEDGIAPTGEKAAKTWLDNFKAHQGDFNAFAKSLGDDFYKSFEGDSDAAMNRVNEMFEEKLAAGGFNAATKFTEQFNSRVKSSFETGGDEAGATLEENIKKHGNSLLAFANTLGKDFWTKFQGNMPGALDEANRLFNDKMGSGGTSSSSKFMDAFGKKFNDKGSNKGILGNFMGDIEEAAGKAGMEAGDIFGNGIAGGVGNAFKIFSQLPPEAQAAIAAWAAAVALAFSSFFAASASAAILGIVGGLGLAAGIAAEMKSPLITDGWNYFKSTATDVFEESAHSFQVPVSQALGILRDDLRSAQPELTHWFETIAPAITTLASAVGDLIGDLAHGFSQSAGAQREVLDGLASSIDIIGKGLEIFFSELQGSGKGAAEALQAIGYLITGLLIGFGNALAAGSMMFEGITAAAKFFLTDVVAIIDVLGKAHIIPQSWVDSVNNAYNSMGKVPSAAKGASDGVDAFGKSADDATDPTAALSAKVNDLTDAFDSAAGSAISADQSAISFASSLKNLKAQADQGTHSMNQNTDASRDLRSHFDAAAQAALSQAEAVRKAAEASGQNGVQASAAYSRALSSNIQSLVNSATAAGMNKDEVATMISTMFGIPKSLATQFFTPGGAAAQNLIDWINANAHDRTMIIRYGYIPISNQQLPPGFGGSNPGGYLGTVHHAATGGVFDAGVYSHGPIVFAEPETNPATGGMEAFIPRMTSDPARVRTVLAEAASWYGLSLVPNGSDSPRASTSAGGTAPSAPRSTSSTSKSVTLNYFGTEPDALTKARMYHDLDLAVA
jgi:hypothetical protein